ncbi:MAG TPA: hypothetical protein PL033_21135 [Candidatus Brocadiia bacterium]|nr:hypothetical protein [Candidatus Brocadiia bacterium]
MRGDHDFSTRRAYPNARWHRMPVFCGWAEQTTQCRPLGKGASELASQSFYESWIAELEVRGLPFGTIVIDDKWQKRYGTFEVDEAKWPAMKSFVDAQHARDRRVLLWLASFNTEGLPPELCLLDDGRPIAADVTNPVYERMLREQIAVLVRDIGIDGFKVDWQCGCFQKPGLRAYAPITGIEFIRRFQYLIYDEAHKWKPDALIESHNCNPLFRDVIDVYRLGDIWFGTRNIAALMRTRSRIARAVGWDVIDCDNGSQTFPDEWFNYMKAQPSIGVPSLYALHLSESTFEELPEYMFRHIADLWKRYIHENV